MSSSGDTSTKRRGCLFWLGGIVFSVITGLAGCSAANNAGFQFYGGIYTRWQPIAMAPDGAVRIEAVQVCASGGNQPLFRIFVRTDDGGLWKRDNCSEAGFDWTEAREGEMMGTGGLIPCDKDPKRADYSVADDRTTGTIVDCQDVAWYWEYWSNSARLVMYSDGRVERWPMGFTLEQALTYAGLGFGAGVVLGGAGYVYYFFGKRRK